MTSQALVDLAGFDRTVAGMLADPDVVGDLLLVGLCMARRTHLGEAERARKVSEMARSVFGERFAAQRWRGAIRGDIRCYDYDKDPANVGEPLCGSPMIRRPTACGKGTTHKTLLTDVDSGRRLWAGACSRHHAWWREQVAANRAAVDAPDRKLPTPAANVGGALRRHLPSFRWADYWRSIDPAWVEPPEVVPFVAPRLQLLITDDFEPDPRPSPRPRLTLIAQNGERP